MSPRRIQMLTLPPFGVGSLIRLHCPTLWPAVDCWLEPPFSLHSGVPPLVPSFLSLFFGRARAGKVGKGRLALLLAARKVQMHCATKEGGAPEPLTGWHTSSVSVFWTWACKISHRSVSVLVSTRVTRLFPVGIHEQDLFPLASFVRLLCFRFPFLIFYDSKPDRALLLFPLCSFLAQPPKRQARFFANLQGKVEDNERKQREGSTQRPFPIVFKTARRHGADIGLVQ